MAIKRRKATPKKNFSAVPGPCSSLCEPVSVAPGEAPNTGAATPHVPSAIKAIGKAPKRAKQVNKACLKELRACRSLLKTRFKQPNSLPSARALKQAGLPLPAPLKFKQADYKALEAAWDKALEADNFDDIERSLHGEAKGRNANYLRGGSQLGQDWRPDRAQFYRLLQTYVTHHTRNWVGPRRIDKYILARLNQGWTYRQILAGARQRLKLQKSLYWLYYRVEALLKTMQAWHRTSKHGLLNPANADTWADDALLSDLRGTAGVIEAPNGLRLDQGWWSENLSEWWHKNGSH